MVVIMKIGFIGLGHMGAGMAATLLKAGHDVTVYNRTKGKTSSLVAQGAREAATISEACRGEVVITMLANDDAVESVVLGRNGVAGSLPAGALHISSSTISTALVERLALEHTKRVQHFVAAPVFGRPDAAASGKLFVVAAGASDAIAIASPLLGALGQKVFVVSDEPKAALLVKVCGNFLTASMIETLGEAFALLEKSGVDPRRFLDIMTSSMFDTPGYKTFGSRIISRDFEPGFAAPLALKDIRLALAAAGDLCVPMPLVDLLRDRLTELVNHGGEQLDWAAIGAMPAPQLH
jgi:3-hydroxyisobutyrate dehydrogenase-like beta-hydroxyacid dehydrogenase